MIIINFKGIKHSRNVKNNKKQKYENDRKIATEMKMINKTESKTNDKKENEKIKNQKKYKE